MATVERTVVINAPVERVFNYVADPTNDPEWIPSAIESKVVTPTVAGVGSTSRWTYKVLGIRLEGTGVCTEYVPNERLVTESKGGVVSTWTYTFEPHEEGTRLTLVIDYTVPIPVLGKFAEALVLGQIEREADLATASLKAILEA